MRIYEYIWIGGAGELRSKTRVYPDDTAPGMWNYDGSSTGQASGEASEVVIQPRALFPNPLAVCKQGESFLVLCDTYADGAPHPTNHRAAAAAFFEDEHVRASEPWYGFEQEYFMFDVATNKPLGFASATKQGQYYCGNGGANAFGRALAEEHMAACLRAGIKISGINAEVAPGQWEFQVGPVEGIAACDQLWVARFLLERLSEKHGVRIVYHPKPLKGDWNGSGGHTNFSTKAMREPGGLEHIKRCIEHLAETHCEDMNEYGEDNHLRLTGLHETSSMQKFSWGIADRGRSVRIGNENWRNECGYFEDRRPAANMDPYRVAPCLAAAAIRD